MDIGQQNFAAVVRFADLSVQIAARIAKIQPGTAGEVERMGDEVQRAAQRATKR